MEYELTEPTNSQMETNLHPPELVEEEEREEEEEQQLKTRKKEEEEQQLKTRKKEEEEQQLKTQENEKEKHPIISTAALPPSSSQTKPLQSQLQPTSTPPPPPLTMPSSDHPPSPSFQAGELSSPIPSPLHPIDAPSNSSLSSDQSTISCLSSPRDETHHNESPPSQPVRPAGANPSSPPHLAAMVSVKRSVRDGPAPLTMVDPGAVKEQLKQETGDGCGGGSGGGGISVSGGARSTGSRPRPGLSILRRVRRESTMKRALLVLRVCGCALCLVSFSVLAADKNKGWALDSFYRYGELRFDSDL